MKKEHIVIVILAILLAVVGVAWIINSQPMRKEWDSVGSWIGSQREYNMTTEQFVIGGEEWRFGWSCNQVIGGSCFEIIVYDVYTDDVVKEIITSFPQTHSGESYLNVKGRFYLEIFIHGTLGDWRVYVQEYR